MNDESNNNGNNGTPAAAVLEAPVAQPVTPPSENGEDLRGQLARATAEIARLQGERDREAVERNRVLAEERLKVATSIAKQPAGKIGIAEQDLQLGKAISAVGGPAYWAKLSLPQQLAAMGSDADPSTSDKVLKQYFGGNFASDSNKLAAENPKEYLRLRLLSKLKGIY